MPVPANRHALSRFSAGIFLRCLLNIAFVPSASTRSREQIRLRKQILLNRRAGIFLVESSSNRKGNLACDRRPVVLERYGTPDLTTFNCVS
jgi:hypothetical protein